MSKETKYVIIGGGVAGLGAIEGIREVDKEGEITLVTMEAYPPYSRPGISYWLYGKLDDTTMPLRDDSFYSNLGVTLMTDCEATSIDTKAGTIKTKGGKDIPFDRLLIATGGSPILPPIDGAEGLDMVFSFTTYKDAREIGKKRDKIKRAVVVGGGLIGLKAAEALNNIGVKVTVLELMDRILSLAFDKTAGDLVAKGLVEAGIEIITEDTAQKVVSDGGKIMEIVLRSGKSVEADALILAIGVRPRVELAGGAGIDVGRGILVDERLMTNIKDIYAAGDASEAYDIIYRERRVTPILPNAYGQGKQAGRNMAGTDEPYEGGLSMNAIGFYGLDTISIGLVDPPENGGYDVLVRLDKENNIYRKLVTKEGRLFGAVLVGEVERAGIFASLIRDGVSIAGLEETMLSGEFGHVHMDRDLRVKRLERR
ncbi:MAG: NAD(P)/FAD-dependent oxidoreductase [Deltaproteobacteria bacterium]|uniref:NAD(P)/FAD-dependent oxidoreductase n=1 Tax=Candidatus Zymogenus saltonus TaxID=2844893 RepID=A0A9D8KGK9_9DELT|nr:NAD(P)/FAD-dependent oxidoreductase [Candidatus Zymogenus saltonus]